MDTWTPGPWKAEVESASGKLGTTYLITNGYIRIAEYILKRDAPIIAAAPELVRAVRDLLPHVENLALLMHEDGYEDTASAIDEKCAEARALLKRLED